MAIALGTEGVRLWENPLDLYGPVNTLASAAHASVVCFGPNGYKLAVGCGSRLRIYSNQRHDLTAREYPGITALSFNPSGRYLAVGCRNHKVYVLDMQAESGVGKTVFELEGHGAPVSAIAFTSSGLFLHSADESGQLITWQVSRNLPYPYGHHVEADAVDVINPDMRD